MKYRNKFSWPTSNWSTPNRTIACDRSYYTQILPSAPADKFQWLGTRVSNFKLKCSAWRSRVAWRWPCRLCTVILAKSLLFHVCKPRQAWWWRRAPLAQGELIKTLTLFRWNNKKANQDGRTRCTTGSVVSSLYHLKDPQHNNEGRSVFLTRPFFVLIFSSRCRIFCVSRPQCTYRRELPSQTEPVWGRRVSNFFQTVSPLSWIVTREGIKIRRAPTSLCVRVFMPHTHARAASTLAGVVRCLFHAPFTGIAIDLLGRIIYAPLF